MLMCKGSHMIKSNFLIKGAQTVESEDTKTEKHNCKVAASMVVDALIDAGIVLEKDSSLAIEIAEEELVVRKALRKL